jgi:hypothetical protein
MSCTDAESKCIKYKPDKPIEMFFSKLECWGKHKMMAMQLNNQTILILF